MRSNIFQRGALFICVVLLCFIIHEIQSINKVLPKIARSAKLFHPSLILSASSNKCAWGTTPNLNHEKFCHVLVQSQLSWIGKGAQAFAFETPDKRFVIKFFYIRKPAPDNEVSLWRGVLSKLRKKKEQNRLKGHNEVFTNLKICSEELSDETGIIYTHLSRTNGTIKTIKLVDRFGQAHRIQGDEVCFVVQKKADYLLPTFRSLLDANDIEHAKVRLNQIFELLLSTLKKGFKDSDEALIRNNNIGFTDTQAIYIDSGRITRINDINVYEQMKYEFDVRLRPLESWFHILYPHFGSYYVQRKEEILKSLEV